MGRAPSYVVRWGDQSTSPLANSTTSASGQHTKNSTEQIWSAMLRGATSWRAAAICKPSQKYYVFSFYPGSEVSESVRSEIYLKPDQKRYSRAPNVDQATHCCLRQDNFEPLLRAVFQAKEEATTNDTKQNAITPKARTSRRGSLSHTRAARQRSAGTAQACVAIYRRLSANGARSPQINAST